MYVIMLIFYKHMHNYGYNELHVSYPCLYEVYQQHSAIEVIIAVNIVTSLSYC